MGSNFFNGPLSDDEVEELLTLLASVDGVYVPEEGSGRTVWNATIDGCFAVSSFFSAIAESSSSSRHMRSLWHF